MSELRRRIGASLFKVAPCLCLVSLCLPTNAQTQAQAQAQAQTQVLLRGGSPKSMSEIANLNTEMGVTRVKELLNSKDAFVLTVPTAREGEWIQRLNQLQKTNQDGFTVQPLAGDYRALFHSLGNSNDLNPSQEKALGAARIKGSGVTSLVRLAPTPLRREALTVGFDTRDGFSQPGSLSVPVEPGKTLDLTRSQATPVEGGYIWRGQPRIAGLPASTDPGEASLIMRGDAVTGTIRVNRDVYTITPLGGGVHAITKGTTSDGPPDHPPRFREKSKPSSTKDSPASSTESTLDVSETIVIDVLVGFSTQAAQEVIDEEGLATLAIEDANQSFIRSGVAALRLRLAGVVNTNYAESGPWETHLDRLSNKKDPVFKTLHAMRNAKKADVVFLMVSDRTACGEARRIDAAEHEAFAVLSHTCTGEPKYSFAHEIGHLLGARHDKGTDPETTPYRWAHGYVNGTKWRTLMAYDVCDGCPRLLHWSNPNILYENEKMGTEDFEFDAKVWLVNARKIAAFRK